MTLAKGLGGGIPIGAAIAIGPAADLLGPGQHGSTYGGNPVAAAAALAVLDTVERDGLLAHARASATALCAACARSGPPARRRDAGASARCWAIVLTEPVAGTVAAAALDAGFIVNAVAPDAVRARAAAGADAGPGRRVHRRAAGDCSTASPRPGSAA